MAYLSTHKTWKWYVVMEYPKQEILSDGISKRGNIEWWDSPKKVILSDGISKKGNTYHVTFQKGIFLMESFLVWESKISFLGNNYQKRKFWWLT